MYSANHWGGSLDISNGGEDDDENKRLKKMDEFDRASLQQMQATQQSWLLYPQETKRKKKYIDLGCVLISAKAFKYTVYAFLIAFLVIALPIIIVETLPHRPSRPPPPDNYTLALHKALLFFNAQKSGKLPKNNGIPWRGDSGLSDGNDTDFKTGLVGGYYDAGDNIKFNFPMAFSMSMLSWSLIEYRHKYETIGEYKHMRELIKWGADYLLLTFNSSASKIDKIYSQVGSPGLNGSKTPNDHYCWQRPEDMDYSRPSQSITSGPDLAGEMAAALASASIVFRDNEKYSQKLVKGAKTVFAFARDGGRRRAYSRGNPYVEPFYNSTGYYDEYMWGAAWMYYATGNISYLSLATNRGLLKNAKGYNLIPNLNVLSWDNKLPAAMLLLTRYRLFINPGYPYEDMLRTYHNLTGLTMCSYLHRFNVYNWTKGGMIQLNKGRPQPLQYVANAAFLTSLFADYLNATDIPGIYCGPTFIRLDVLKNFATSQIDYILGKNPKKMSYVVGFGSKFPRHVHHRGASIPHNGRHYSCTGGLRWRDSSRPNPNNVTGAMVGGPDRFDKFRDVRSSYNFTEPTLAGNAGLVAALASLTASGESGSLDKNSIFSAVPPLYPPSPPPPKPWKP